MRKGQPRRIRGVNLFVGDLNLAVEYYERRMGLVLDGRFGREAFLCWRSGGEDFLGLFQGRNRGWHHVEEAQQRIVNAVRKLEESGEIVIARGGAEELVM